MSLSQILYILRRRWRWIASLAVAGLVVAALVVLLVPPRYDAVAAASIDSGVADPINNQMGQGSGAAILYFQGNMVALVKSNRVALEVVDRLSLTEDEDLARRYAASGQTGVVGLQQWIANDLVDHVDAKFGDKSGNSSNVLTITFKSPSPIKSATVANAFLDSFMKAAVDMKAAFAKTGAQWFDPQIAKIRSELVEAQTNLAKFQRESNVLAASGGDSENDQLLQITSELSRTKAELIAFESQLAGSASAAAQSNEAQSIDQGTLAALRQNLSTIDAEIARLQKEIGAGNPKLVERMSARKSLVGQIDALIADDRARLKDRIAQRKDKIAQLEKARAEQMKNMIEVQAKRDQLSALQHEVEFRQTELERAQRSASTQRLQSQLSFSNIAVLDRSTPPTTVGFPKTTIVWAAGIGGGLTLGLMAALLLEFLNRPVRFQADLAYLFEAPVLGTMRSSRQPEKSKVQALLEKVSASAAARLPKLRHPRLPGPSSA